MSRTRLWLLGIAGLLLPVALATAAFLISSKVGASADSPAVIQEQNSKINDQSSGRGEGRGGGGESPEPEATPSADDHGGRCSEPEHASDPECTGSGSGSPQPTPTDDHGGGSDSSGKGSGGSDSSGSGSDGSGGGKDDHPDERPDDHSGKDD